MPDATDPDYDDDPKPPDDAPRAERTAWNRREHERRSAALAERAKEGMTNAALDASALTRAHAHAGKGSRAAMRRATKATILAVLDPESGATTRDRLDAARLGATITGLAKAAPTVVVLNTTAAFGALWSAPVADASDADETKPE